MVVLYRFTSNRYGRTIVLYSAHIHVHTIIRRCGCCVTVVIPMSAYLRREAQKVRRSFADKTFSDHMCVLRAFQVRVLLNHV